MSDSLFLLRSSLINLVGLALRIVVSPLMLFVPRFFPQDLFGVFVSLRSLLLFAQQVLGLGLGQGLAWWIPGRFNNEGLRNRTVWGTVLFAMLIAMGGSMILFLAYLLFHERFPTDVQNASPVFLAICLSSIPGTVVLTTACGCMDGIRQPVYRAFIGQSLSVGLIPILIFVLLFCGVPDSLAWSLFFSSWLCAAFVLWRMRTFFPVGSGIDVIPERKLLTYSITLSLGRWVDVVLANLDLWLVAVLLGTSNAALYGVMQMLANGIRVVRRSYEPMVVPVVSSMDSDKIRERLPEVLSYSTHMICSLQMAVAVLLVCFYRELLSISGGQYAEFPLVFILLVLSNLIAGFQSTSSQVLLGLGKTSVMLKIRLAMLVTATISGIPLVNTYGLAGAACMPFSIGILNAVVLFCMQTRICGSWLFQKVFYVDAVLLAAFVMVTLPGVSFLSHTSFLIRLSIFIVVSIGFGILAFINRKSFVPRLSVDQH